MSAFTLPPCVLEPPAAPSTQLLHVFHQRQRGSSMGIESPSPWIILLLSDILPYQKAACPLKATCNVTSPFPNRPDSRDRMAVSILEHGATPSHLNSVCQCCPLHQACVFLPPAGAIPPPQGRRKPSQTVQTYVPRPVSVTFISIHLIIRTHL